MTTSKTPKGGAAENRTLHPPSPPLVSLASLPSLFSLKRPAQFAESAKLEAAIRANLKGLGFQ